MIAIGLAGVAWLSVFGHRGVAPCAAFMALGVALRPAIWRQGFALLAPARVLSQPLSIAAVSILCFCLWIATGVLWSPTPGAEWLALTALAATLTGGALSYEAVTATPARAARLAGFYIAMVCVAAAALMFEGLSGGYLRLSLPPADVSPLRWKDMTALGRGVTAAAGLVFPAAALLYRVSGSRLVALAPVAALFIASLNLSVYANVAALIAGAAAFALALIAPRSAFRALVGVFVLALFAAPFIAWEIPVDAILAGEASALPPSWAQRLVVWRETATVAMRDCLPVGCGADFSRAFAENGATIRVPGWPIDLPVMPTHPHNMFLQIWLELGLPGVLLLATAGLFAARAFLASRVDRLTMSAACGALGVCFISVIFEASLWQVWRLAVFALAAFGVAMSYSVNKIK